jgi:hypothetical protein
VSFRRFRAALVLGRRSLKLMKNDPNSTPLDEASMRGFMTALGIPIH